MPTIHDERQKLAALKRELEQEAPMETMRGSVALTAEALDDQGMSWIEVMPAVEKAQNGRWFFTITPDDLQTAAAYIQQNPDRIPIDYDHAGAEGGSTKAAGWYTGNAEVRDSSLWAQVKWTKAAIEEIRDGVFRFLSPEWTMENKDAETGLWTKFKEMAASTLTNRPFFSEMAPVTASEATDAGVVEAVRESYGDEVADLLLGAVWTTAYVNNLPDSSFLYIEPGGSKDSEGKTEPRSLRHFPVKDASGNPDMAHVRNALARIPQSNVPASAKAAATARCQRMLRDMGGNPSATDQGTEDDKRTEATVADEQPVTDYMKMLGLDETVDPKHRLAAAFREKDEKILALTQEVTELRAGSDKSAEETDKLTARIADLEKRDRQRDIEVILARAVERGRVLPAEKETLTEVFANDVDGLKRLIATRPSELFAPTEKGIAGDPDRFADEPDVQQLAAKYSGPVDTESAKLHLATEALLREQGKGDNYTTDEYLAASKQAAKSLVY